MMFKSCKLMNLQGTIIMVLLRVSASDDEDRTPLLSAVTVVFSLQQRCMSTQCGVVPVCVPIELFSTNLNPVWCWSSVCPHRAIFNQPQPSVVLVQYVSP